ncbi:MAG: Fe-S cluster assembly protein SufD [Flavobacteriales bacterium]
MVAIHVAKNKIAETPIHIIHYCDDEHALSTPSVFVALEQSASIDITETFHGNADAKSLTIRGLYAQVNENARLEYTKIQAENDNQFTIHSDNLRVETNGYSNFNTLTIDGGWVRNDLRIDLNGQNIEAHLSGFYLPRNKQMIDNHTKVDHKYAHCESNELYKGILFDQSSGVFNGKVFVYKDAQKTNAYQNNANILASDDAQMNTKPELEIYADDVKCSHGTTTGQIDESAMFYLRARGMSEDSARKLLTTAFINDVIEKVANKAVKAHVLEALSNKGLLYI